VSFSGNAAMIRGGGQTEETCVSIPVLFNSGLVEINLPSPLGSLLRDEEFFVKLILAHVYVTLVGKSGKQKNCSVRR
jgi:gamma-glutamyl phosphate reductase